jgi:hypothetical protein
MTTLEEARSKGKLDQFIKEHERHCDRLLLPSSEDMPLDGAGMPRPFNADDGT